MSLLGNCHQILELAQEHCFQPLIRLPSRRLEGGQFGCMIILRFENAKTIDSINVATWGSGDE
jgi:hypothetical protein